MKNSFLVIFFACFSMNSFAQKQSFDVVSFTAPKDWQQQQNEGGMQLSVTDKKTGGYAIAVITKATNTVAAANENFNNNWTRLVKSSVQVNEEPAMQQPTQENGWDVISGNANYTEGSKKGMATLLTATGGNQTVSVILMTNTQQFQNELLALLNSLELSKIASTSGNIKIPSTASSTIGASIVGLWTDYILETTGYYINNMPQYTSGYLRKEYAFNANGTYVFRNKQWLTKAPDITFLYETGTYTINGNQLTITPENGKGGFWGKKSSTKDWGPLIKLSDYKLEKTVYTVEMINDPTYGNSLVIKPTKPTQRDGGKFNAPNDPIEFHYKLRTMESLIDNPPGFKTGGEDIKSINAPVSTQANPNASQLTGIWGQYQSESNTAGYDWREYYFSNDGTYQFLQKNISYLYQNEIVFTYEKGTFKLNGNQLTISPQIGTVESWSKAGSDKAGKLLKTEKRTLENVTYTTDFHYFPGIKETNLVLQYNRQTVRDGAWSTNNSFKNSWLYKRPFNPDKPSIELPAGSKIPFENISFTAPAKTTINNNTPAAAISSPLTGKIWEARSYEKYGAAYGSTSGAYTGGFWYYQYKFNEDGTYIFVYNAASALATNPVNILQYETGTYTVNSNQLTLTPQKGSDEEWSVGKTNNGMSANHIQEVLEKRMQRLKTITRKLEKITYPFTIEYWQGNNANALCLKHTQSTVREGSPGQNNQTCFFETAVAKAGNYNSVFK